MATTVHRRATEDGKLMELENGTPREDGVLLRKLRCGSPTWLRSIAARYGGALNATCDRCDAGKVEDVEHFICDCSAWDHARLQELGAVRDVADLRFVKNLARLLWCAGVGLCPAPE